MWRCNRVPSRARVELSRAEAATEMGAAGDQWAKADVAMEGAERRAHQAVRETVATPLGETHSRCSPLRSDRARTLIQAHRRRSRYPRPKSNRRRRALVRAVKQEAKRWVAEVMATEAVDKTSEVAKQELWWHRW